MKGEKRERISEGNDRKQGRKRDVDGKGRKKGIERMTEESRDEIRTGSVGDERK